MATIEYETVRDREEGEDEVELRVHRDGLEGELLAAVVSVPGACIEIGSDPAAEISVAEPTVSRRHLRVLHGPRGLEIVDLGSRNGTYLLGHRVEHAEIGPGSQLRFGRAVLHVSRPRELVRTHEPVEALPGVLGSSPPMLALSRRVRRLSPLGVPVFLRGESGTGKELVARAIHALSRRRGRLVSLNAATLSRELAESELFGHRRGSFTGAIGERIGAFREATGGTLFIDEIARLSLEVQAKLLRAVEDGVVRPLGGDGDVAVEVRMISATCEPLEQLVDRGLFRRDLYERLAVCVVRVPPLRERIADLPELARHLLARDGFATHRVSEGGLRALASSRLPGNVRELRAMLVLSAIAAGERGVIDERDVESAWLERAGRPLGVSPAEAVRAVGAFGGNTTAAARHLGVPRSTLRDAIARSRRVDAPAPTAR